MNSKGLFTSITDSVKRYSSDGDKSLEYIGITTDFDEYTDLKVYRKKPLNEILASELPECIQSFISKTETENPGLRFFDFSSRGVRKEERLFSVSFLFNPVSLGHTCIDDEARIIMRTFEKRRNPTIQKGFLIDNSANVLEEKIYYTLNSDQKTYTFEKRHNFMMDKRKQVIGYMVHTLNNADSIFTEELFDLSLQLGYRLFMTGYNISGTSRFGKLYFVYDSKKNRDTQLNNSLELFKKIGGGEFASELIGYCNALKLLLKGFACENRDKPLWRLYFSVPY